ncbi:hypothetical protein WH96_11305 [Kiloniella spongiae]|uniref:Uncharacterized protein n=1 Tax=Kiloniella spongiae TaxID=1489064 RepID=A0A0H2MF73_9PROT|nr:hypothetical protein WH96_11305 [Kiloniella spongiae]
MVMGKKILLILVLTLQNQDAIPEVILVLEGTLIMITIRPGIILVILVVTPIAMMIGLLRRQILEKILGIETALEEVSIVRGIVVMAEKAKIFKMDI